MEMSKKNVTSECVTRPGETVGMEKQGREVWHKKMKRIAWFALAHLVAYFIVGWMFLLITSWLSEESRRALDFFTFYQPIGGLAILSQLIRGMIIGVVCLPLLKVMEESTKPWLLLTGLVWGVGIFGSVEPLPGSFEGMLYTTTSAAEHLMALLGSLVQVLLMAAILIKTGTIKQRQKKTAQEADEALKDNSSKGIQAKYLKQFTLFHVATYFLVGMVFYQISGYEEALATMEMFALWRPLENLVMPVVIFLGQFIRGFVLAVLFIPYYRQFLQTPGGWKWLFLTLWGMTFLAAVNIVPWVVQDLWLGNNPPSELLIGPPEVTVQMLLFSVLLYAWHRSTISLPGLTMVREVSPAKVDSRAGK